MARVRGGDESGAGALEYVGAVVAAGVLIAGLVLVFPSAGERLTCRVSQAIGTITRASVSCSHTSAGESKVDESGSAGGSVTGPDSTGFVTPRTTATSPGTSRLEFTVDAPEGESWTVQSDQPWVTVPDNRVFDGPTITGFYGQTGGGNGPGTQHVVVHANPSTDGKPRTATLTFTGPNGETFTQEITQGGKTAQTVVLGDSFSAGIGSAQKNPDTSIDDCHRSSKSWGRQLEAGTDSGAGTPSVALSAFGACSGGTVNGTDLTGKSGSPSLLAQIKADKDALAEADQVAFTIGGNDIGFAPIVADCVNPFKSVGVCHQAVVDGTWRIRGKGGEPSPLRARLEEGYQAMLEAAPNATIYVVGYPPMVEMDDSGRNPFDFGEVKPQNRQEVVDMLNDLNFEIETTVDAVNRSTPGGGRLVFVDPMKDGSPFHGHSLTDDDPYYHGLELQWPKRNTPPLSYQSFHPNDAGNEAYAQLIGGSMLGQR